MAGKEDVVKSKSSGRLNLVTIGLLLAAALASVGGFLLLFSMWWTTDVTQPESLLRLASREFVDGRPIVAGKLAELVEFARIVENPTALELFVKLVWSDTSCW